MNAADLQEVRSTPLFAKLTDEQLSCLDGGEIIEAPAGTETETSDVSEQRGKTQGLAKADHTSGALPVPANPDGGLKLVEPSSDKPDKTTGEVVRLDRFRKK